MLGVKIWCLADKARRKLEGFWKEENGEVNIVTIVVLIGIAILLAIFFREQIEGLLESLFSTITGNATNAISGGGN